MGQSRATLLRRVLALLLVPQKVDDLLIIDVVFLGISSMALRLLTVLANDLLLEEKVQVLVLDTDVLGLVRHLGVRAHFT